MIIASIFIYKYFKLKEEYRRLTSLYFHERNLKKVFETDAKEYYIRVIQLEDKIKKMKKET